MKIGDTFYCPECGEKLTYMVGIGFDESFSGEVEVLMYCKNCLSSFEATFDPVTEECTHFGRYFFG